MILVNNKFAGRVNSFIESPQFLRDIIFISRTHSLLFSIYHILISLLSHVRMQNVLSESSNLILFMFLVWEREHPIVTKSGLIMAQY